jgi:predicted transposase/invertase (TIGR01784 family)
MRTDSIFYSLFQELPDTFFRIIGQDPSEAAHYRFTSEEVKETGFRIDAVFDPVDGAPETLLYFAEVQFWDDPDFYFGLFAEILIFLKHHKPGRRWKAVAMFANRGLDPGVPIELAEIADAHLVTIYLDEWARQHSTGSLGVRMVKLILEPPETAFGVASSLIEGAWNEAGHEVSVQTALDLIETLLVYKFSELSREEIEVMFQLTDLRQTRVFQEALEEGKKEGKDEGLKEGKDEGLREGKDEGLKEGKLSAVPVLIKLGMSADQAARELGLPIGDVQRAATQVSQEVRA